MKWWETLLFTVAREYLIGEVSRLCIGSDWAKSLGNRDDARIMLAQAEEKLELLRQVDEVLNGR